MPDGGEPGAQATFELTFDADNQVVCYDITSDGVSGDYESPAHTSTHIHQGDFAEGGPPRVAFANPTPVDADESDGELTASGCHHVPQATNTGDPDNGVGFDLAEIEANPTNFYVDIHTEGFPGGAVRGQFVTPQVQTDVQLNWMNEVADTPEGDVTAQRGQDSFDADGVDADLFFGDVDDTAAAGLADDGNGDLTLRWNADDELGAVFLHVAGEFRVTSELADDVFDGFPIHLHEGAVDVNGPVDLPFATPTDVEVIDDLGGGRELLEYTINQTLTPDDVDGLADVLADLEADMAAADVGDVLDYYVNVHTQVNVPGEIRGHLQAVNLLAGESATIDGGRSQLPPVFTQVEATGGLDTVTLAFDIDVADAALDPSGFRVEVDGDEASVLSAVAVDGSVELVLTAAPDAGEVVEVTILDTAAQEVVGDDEDRDGTAETSVRLRAATVGAAG